MKEPNDAFVANALRTENDDLVDQTEQMKDNIVGICASTNVHQHTTNPMIPTVMKNSPLGIPISSAPTRLNKTRALTPFYIHEELC